MMCGEFYLGMVRRQKNSERNCSWFERRIRRKGRTTAQPAGSLSPESREKSLHLFQRPVKCVRGQCQMGMFPIMKTIGLD